MADVISCPHCQKRLRLPDSLLGKPVKCPTCGETFQAAADPRAAPEPPPALPSVPPPLPPGGSGSAAAPPRHDDDLASRRRRDLLPHKGAAVLVLGILGIVMSGLIVLGPIAWFLGHGDLREMREGRMDPEGESLTRAGWICGIVGTCISAMWLVFCCLYMGFLFVMIGTGAGAAGQ